MRRLAAEFERELLERAGRVAHELLADLRRAGEGDGPYVGVLDQGGAGDRSAPGRDVPRACREADLVCQLGHAQRRQRRFARRLVDDGVACSQGHGQLACREQHREVPRRDQAHDADGLAQRVGEKRTAHGNGGALDLRRQTGVVVEAVGAQRHVEHARLGDGLARIGAFECGELVGTFQHAVAQLPQQLAALRGRHTAPLAVDGGETGLHRSIDVAAVGGGDLTQDAGVRRIDAGEALPRSGRAPLAADVEIERWQTKLGGFTRLGAHVRSFRCVWVLPFPRAVSLDAACESSVL